VDAEAWDDAEAPAPVGDGVRVLEWVADEPCPLVCGVGVKTEGTDEPLPLAVQAETATARRTAPAAERPAISHAP
jgi:hypothetical protein